MSVSPCARVSVCVSAVGVRTAALLRRPSTTVAATMALVSAEAASDSSPLRMADVIASPAARVWFEVWPEEGSYNSEFKIEME